MYECGMATECSDTWFKTKPECPTCRRSVVPGSPPVTATAAGEAWAASESTPMASWYPFVHRAYDNSSDSSTHDYYSDSDADSDFGYDSDNYRYHY